MSSRPAERSRPLALRASLLSTVAGAFLLAGCATQPSAPPTVAAVNAEYRAGFVDIPTQPLPSLEEIINRVPSRSATTSDSKEDRLRGGAMRDAALSYGARAGLAWESRAINSMLMNSSDKIARTYDFQRVMIKGPGNSMLLPPVISQANEAWETSEAGKTLRVADTVYQIIDQARFSAVAPQWQSYLVRDYKTPEPPPDMLLPKDGGERDQWRRWVGEGWQHGQKQAQDIFQADLERLERDFAGMVRYKALLEQGKVSAPVVADSPLGTTGTGQDMRVNDRAIKITRDPSLQVDGARNWSAPATTPGPDGVPTGQGPKVEAPPQAKPAAKPSAPRRAVRTETTVRTPHVPRPRREDDGARRHHDAPPPPSDKPTF